MMAAVAAVETFEVLKVATQLLLSPAIYASNIVLGLLGYVPTSTNSMVTSFSPHAILSTAQGSQSSLQPSRSWPVAGLPTNFADRSEDSSSSYPKLTERYEGESERRIQLLEPDRSLVDDGSKTEMPLPPQPNFQRNEAAASPLLPSDDDEANYPAKAGISILDGSFPTPSASIIESSSARPLSLVFSQFTRRTTMCLSSFELLHDDGEATVGTLAAAALSSHAAQEPTVAQQAYVQERLGEELWVVEREIQKAVERRGVSEAVVGLVENEHTYFEMMDQSFVTVPIFADGIDTIAFLDAIGSCLTMFELFAPSAHALICGEIREDIRRVRVRYSTTPTESRTLQLLVASESKERRRLATESLLWLLRGLKFTAMALRSSVESPTQEELSVSFNRAWELEYCKYFSWVLRPLFKLLLKACPARADLYDKLGSPPEKVKEGLKAWLSALELQVSTMEAFYRDGR